MAGILTGLGEGIAAGAGINQRQQEIDVLKAREDREQERQDRAQARQDTRDALEATQTELSDIGHQGLAARTVLASVPEDPTEAAAYRTSDEYQNALKTVGDLNAKTQPLIAQRQRHLDTLAGNHVAEAKARLPATQYKLATEGVGAVSPSDLSDAVQLKTKMPPNVWVKDPESGMSSMDQANATLGRAISTGNFDDPEALHAASSLMPELHLAVGAQTPEGGTVVHAAPAGLHYDPKDPNYLIVSKRLITHQPDGSYTHSHTPAMADGSLRVPVADLVDRYKRNVAMAQQLSDPAAQEKLSTALQTGDTLLHRYDADLAGAGVPESDRLPAYKSTVLPAGGNVLVQQPGQAPRIIAGPDKRTAHEKDVQSLMEATGLSREDAEQRMSDLKHDYSGPKDPNLRSPRGGSKPPKITEGDMKAADATLLNNALTAHGGNPNAPVDKGQDPFHSIKDPAAREAARQEYNQGRVKLRAKRHSNNLDLDNEPLLAPPSATAPAPARVAVPAIGEKRGGYTFKGGNPADRANWTK